MESAKRNKNILIKICSILLLGGALIFYFYQNNPSDNNSFFLRCPSNFLFNIDCPGCGTQRAIHHLLHLEIAEAFRFNALFVLFSPLILVVIALLIYNFIFDKSVRLPFLANKYFLIVIIVIILLFGILRNIPIELFN
ncbi:DUF2752 domain-containing protein [Faecalibacter bovis]|uniref:DUF2752 domain-containing protein n=1 Tax=Faecalibacter bovis TaxID=2898187 RepID=A0ABX7XER6_9FLAO|nr:DUF2752 domain-containing protein [Faecalibacter bovis]QTV06302.1 DUF2752 domain-containing protein [Faecalibacter bovis]